MADFEKSHIGHVTGFAGVVQCRRSLVEDYFGVIG